MPKIGTYTEIATEEGLPGGLMTQQEPGVRSTWLAYWGQSWTLTAWCEMRAAFRSFRLDRIDGLHISDDHFENAPGQTLADFLALVQAEAQAPRPIP